MESSPSSPSGASGAATPLPTTPRRLGRYEVLGKIASGGMATVYLARAVGSGGFERIVALKRCHEHLRDDPEFRAMFLDEARLAASIHHPKVVATIDVSDDGGDLFLVMEYVEGGGVADLFRAVVEAGERFPIDVAVRIMVDALEGLGAAHATRGPDGAPLELVHRDVSPQNLLVGIDGTTRVTDFGIAKAAARATITEGQQVKGKLSYMAPEQAQSSGLTAKTDLWAAAAVLWELVTGERLFLGDSRSDTMQKVLFLPIPSPRKHRPELSEALEAVILRGLSRAPDDRYASATEFAEALEAVGPLASHRDVGAYVSEHLAGRLRARRATHAIEGAGETPVPATSDAVSRVERTGRGRRRSFLVAIAVAVVLGIGLGLAIWELVLGDDGTGSVEAPTDLEPDEPTAPAVEPMPEEILVDEPTLEAPEPAAAEEAAPAAREPTMRRSRRRRARRGMMSQDDVFRPDTI